MGEQGEILSSPSPNPPSLCPSLRPAAIAGRQLLENLFAGILLFTTQPFVESEEIVFTYNGVVVDGFVDDVGWMRTTVRGGR